jgi:hypothetical protein
MAKGTKMKKKCVVCDVAHYTVWDTCGPCAANELQYEAALRPKPRLAKCGHMSTVNRHRCPDCHAKAANAELDGMEDFHSKVRDFDLRRIDPTYDPRKESELGNAPGLSGALFDYYSDHPWSEYGVFANRG